MTIDPIVRTQIVLGAVNAATAKLAALTTQAAGDRDALDRLPDLEALIARSAAEITAAIDPKSAVSRLIDAVHGSKVFTAVVTEVVKEPSSTRGLVTLRTRRNQFHPTASNRPAPNAPTGLRGCSWLARCAASSGTGSRCGSKNRPPATAPGRSG